MAIKFLLPKRRQIILKDQENQATTQMLITTIAQLRQEMNTKQKQAFIWAFIVGQQ